MKVTYVNENEIKKNKKFTLRKIAVGLALASTILLSGCGKDTDLEEVKNKYDIDNIDELDLSERVILEKLKDYEKAYNDFQSDKDNVEKRVVLVKETKKLSDIANQLISDKINVAMGTDYEISIENVDNERKVFGDSQNLGIDIPLPLNEIMNNKDFIDSNTYGGDGSNSAWDSAIDEYNDKGMKLYESILKHVEKDYQLDGSKLEVAKAETNQNVR